MSAAVIDLLPARRTSTGDPGTRQSVEELAEQMVGLAAGLAAMMCRWLLLVARFDELDGAAQYGLPCTSRWLAHACGLAHRTAIEHVRVARGLAAFPELARAMGSGALSYSQVRAISRVPLEGEHEVVADLIEFARHASAAQLETVVRGMRTAAANDDADTDSDDPESSDTEVVTSTWTDGARWRLTALLAPERGAVVDGALDAIVAAEKITRAEALVRLSEIGLAAVAAQPTTLPALRGDERAAAVVHLHLAEPEPVRSTEPEPEPVRSPEPERSPEPSPVPLRTADRIGAAGTRRREPLSPVAASTAWFWRGAHLADGPGVPRNVVERLLCQGRVRTVAHGSDGSVLDVGRSRRVVTERQFRALLIDHDGTCAYPGCVRRERLEAHHVQHWLRGGRTDLANLTLLCETHHHAHHEGAFDILGTRGRRQFVRADGLLLPSGESIAAGSDAPASSGGTTVPVRLAGGDRLDRRWVISVLTERREHAGRNRPCPA